MREIKFNFFIVLFIMQLGACATQNEIEKGKKYTKTNGIFIEGAEAIQDEIYEQIKGTTARLRALMCGKYVQYQKSGEEYIPWLVNDGLDSIIAYQIPIGDKNKNGYWIGQYYLMTSLMDKPISKYLYQLVPMGRDTIKAIAYTYPENFNVSMKDILQNPKKTFEELDFKSLKVSKENAPIYYIRKSIIHYIGTTKWLADERPENEGGFLKVSLDVRPSRTLLGYSEHDKDKKLLKEIGPNCLFKRACVNPKWLE